MITISITWIIGPGFNVAYMYPTAMITPTGECTVYSIWPSDTTQKAVGVFTIFIQFILPLLMLCYGYSRMALVLHRRVDTGGEHGGGAAGGGDKKEAKRNESMARARANVIKTLVMVGICFIVCWTWNQVGIVVRVGSDTRRKSDRCRLGKLHQRFKGLGSEGTFLFFVFYS